MNTIPIDGGFPQFAAWLVFGVLALCFGLALVADYFEGKGGDE